jgi:hypothetical protein
MARIPGDLHPQSPSAVRAGGSGGERRAWRRHGEIAPGVAIGSDPRRYLFVSWSLTKMKNPLDAMCIPIEGFSILRTIQETSSQVVELVLLLHDRPTVPHTFLRWK